MSNVLDIFYNEIIPEAASGKVVSYFTYFTIFSTIMLEEGKRFMVDKEHEDDYLAPVLLIKNKEKLDEAIIEYMDEALKFYDDSFFDPSILAREEGSSKEKILLTLAFSNFTPEDFTNPDLAFKRRTEYLRNNYVGEYELGYSDELGCHLKAVIDKDKIFNETPYSYGLVAYNDNGDEYNFPQVKFGLTDSGRMDIYAIQGSPIFRINNEKTKQEFHKRTNRRLYKVNADLEEPDEIEYGLKNVTDVTASFVIAATSALSFFQENGIRDVNIPPILLVRANAKRKVANAKRKVANQNDRNNRHGKFNETFLSDAADSLQQNLTEKFLRTFRRIETQVDGININYFPSSPAESMMIRMDDELSSKNRLLEEVKELSKGSGQKCK